MAVQHKNMKDVHSALFMQTVQQQQQQIGQMMSLVETLIKSKSGGKDGEKADDSSRA